MRLLPSWKRKSEKQVKIPWSTVNADIVSEAKAAIKDAEPRKALDILADLQSPQLDEQITLLINQLARYRRENIQGTQASEEKNVTFNRISARILSLINIIEEGLASEEKEYKEVKDYLRERYQNRLNQKLAGRQPVNLRRLPSTEGTSEETSAIFKSFGVDEIRDEMTKVFHDTHGRLLIIGKPGAGKTVLMLQLVIRLLDREKDALPVVLNLASWQSSFGKLENWLEKIIPSELGVNSNFAKKITQQYRLILLLDGFDEVKEEERVSCLEAIGKYGADAGRQFVVASRINEYKAVAQDAPVYGQIEVGPLSIEQIETELERVGHDQPEALRLLHAIRNDELLREAVQTPFYFNTMQLMFADGKRWSDFGFLEGTVEGRQREVMERFVESGLTGQENDRYSSEQIKHWLSYFSFQMNRHNLVVFELRDLQYGWWSWSRIEIVPIQIVSFIVGFFFASSSYSVVGVFSLFLLSSLLSSILFSLYFGLFTGVPAGFIFGFIIIIILGLVFLAFDLFLVLIFSLLFLLISLVSFAVKLFAPLFFPQFLGRVVETPLIETKEKFEWSLRKFHLETKKYRKHFLLMLAIGLLFGMLIGLSGNLIIGLLVGLSGGLLFGLSYVLYEGLGGMVANKYNYIKFLQINTPYQRFTASIKAFHFSILQHLLLRYQLYRQGLLPLRLVDFLNDMAKRHFLETDGATWRFRHRLIQDYFAEMWEEPQSND